VDPLVRDRTPLRVLRVEEPSGDAEVLDALRSGGRPVDERRVPDLAALVDALSPIAEADDPVVVFAGVAGDEVQAALRLSEARYRSLVESIPVAVYIDEAIDESSALYRTKFLSPQIERILGYPPRPSKGTRTCGEA
jgi:PAS domain-containing protein